MGKICLNWKWPSLWVSFSLTTNDSFDLEENFFGATPVLSVFILLFTHLFILIFVPCQVTWGINFKWTILTKKLQAEQKQEKPMCENSSFWYWRP